MRAPARPHPKRFPFRPAAPGRGARRGSGYAAAARQSLAAQIAEVAPALRVTRVFEDPDGRGPQSRFLAAALRALQYNPVRRSPQTSA